MAGIELIIPDWPAPQNVQAASTTRSGGVSAAPWTSLNLGDHVGDDPAAVGENRQRLVDALRLSEKPLWLTQVHGSEIADAHNPTGCEADGRYASRPGQVCVVLTADCLPVLLCDRAGTQVAAVHAGWRGLAGGVIEAALDRFQAVPNDILAWLGPAIGPAAFEVGDEVREAFVTQDLAAAEAFQANRPGHWLADIHALARLRFANCGVAAVYGGGLCTYSDASRFYSFRRESVTGRMASLVWLKDFGEVSQ